MEELRLQSVMVMNEMHVGMQCGHTHSLTTISTISTANTYI